MGRMPIVLLTHQTRAMTQQSYDLNVTNNFANETVLAIGSALVNHVNALNAAEIAARSNADAENLAALQSFIAAATTRMNSIEQKADTLTGGEFSQLEEVIMQVLNQPGFASLLGGLSVTIGANSYAMSSVVAALASVRQIARRDQANFVGGLPRLLTLVMTDGSQRVFTAAEVITPAIRDAQGNIVTPELRTYTYTCPDFGGGVPAAQVYAFRADPVVIGGLSIAAASMTELSRTQIIVDLTGQFTGSVTPTLTSPELSGDDYLGTTPPAPPPAPTPAPAPDLVALAAAVAAAQTALDGVTTTRSAAQVSLASAVTARDAAQAEVQTAYDALTAANAALQAAADDLVAAESAGDAELITSATAARDAAQQVADAALNAYNSEQADVTAGDALVGEANTALNAAQAAYDAAVAALTAAQAALTAAGG